MIINQKYKHPQFTKLLQEKYGIFEYDNNEFNNDIKDISLTIFYEVYHNDNIQYDSEIKDIYEGKLYKKYTIQFNNSSWLNICNIYIQLDDDFTDTGIVDSFVLSKDTDIITNKETNYTINFDNQISFPYNVKNNKIDICSIVIIINPYLIKSFNIIFNVIRHELKHIYYMFMSKKANDEINYDIKHMNNLNLINISLYNDKNKLSYKQQNQLITCNNILLFFKKFSYLLNKSEIFARLENIHNDIKQNINNIDIQDKQLLNNISKISSSLQDYQQLYKAINDLISNLNDNIKYQFGQLYLKEISNFYKYKFIQKNDYIKGFDNFCNYFLKIIKNKIFKNALMLYKIEKVKEN